MYYNAEWVTCPQCGSVYHKDAAWKRICLDCWKRNKQADTTVKIDADKLRQLQEDRDYWYDRCTELQRQQNATPKDSNVVQQIKARVKDLIFLAHPDKHGNSQKSNELTALLIQLRKEAQA